MYDAEQLPLLDSKASTEGEVGDDDLEEDDNVDGAEETSAPARERRSSRFTFVERIGTMAEKMESLRRVHQPFCSVVQLRIPGALRGGHDFYYDGRVTNKSDSFAEHRATLSYVLSLYRRSTESAEKSLWMSTDPSGESCVEHYKLHGAPVVMRFGTRLSDAVFERWMKRLVAKRGRFRIWGNPISVGPHHYHIYGVDRHLWQPVYLELSPEHLVAILPKGTCGNTVHRLVSNIQRFVDPAVETWIGDESYLKVVEKAGLAR